MDGIKELLDILKVGGPTATAAIFLVAWLLERKSNWKLQHELLELSKAQVQANVQMNSTMTQFRELVTNLMAKQ